MHDEEIHGEIGVLACGLLCLVAQDGRHDRRHGGEADPL